MGAELNSIVATLGTEEVRPDVTAGYTELAGPTGTRAPSLPASPRHGRCAHDRHRSVWLTWSWTAWASLAQA